MRGSVHFGCGHDDKLIEAVNLVTNFAILYFTVQILHVSQRNVGYNAQIAESAKEINQKLNNKGKKE